MLNENENNNENGNHSHTGLYIAGGVTTVVSLGAATTAILSGRKTRAMVAEDREELRKLKADMTNSTVAQDKAHQEVMTAVDKITVVLCCITKAP